MPKKDIGVAKRGFKGVVETVADEGTNSILPVVQDHVEGEPGQQPARVAEERRQEQSQREREQSRKGKILCEKQSAYRTLRRMIFYRTGHLVVS